MSVRDFYDGLTHDYELVYGGDWDGAVERQAAALDRLIREVGGGAARDVLDCSCGIGTQAIGLALRGYRVHGTDLSERAVERARAEAARLGADVTFGVADFRDLSVVDATFDVVLSYDNAVPHLLGDADLAAALRAMLAKLRPGGLLVIGTRDHDRALVERPPVAPPIVVAGPPRRVLVRLHDWDDDAPCYTVRYLVLTETERGWTVHEHTTRYRALTRAALAGAAAAAGFDDVTWHAGEDVGLGQQVLTGSAP